MNTQWAVMFPRKSVVLALGCLVGLSACLVAPPETPGSGSTQAPEGRTSFSVTLLPDGDVLVVGGQRDWVSRNDVHLYHPKTGRWSVTGSLQEDRTQHSSLLLSSGRVLVWGGRRQKSLQEMTPNLTTMEIYDPATGRWSRAAPMRQENPRVTLLRDGRVLVTGGSINRNVTERVDLYDPSTDQWSERAPMHLPRGNHMALLLSDGKVLVAGGRFRGQSKEAELYDPATNTWTLLRSMNGSHLGSVAYPRQDGRVLVIGGDSDVHGEFYTPRSDTWIVHSIYEAGPPPGSFSTRTVLPDGRILFAGGLLSQEKNTSEVKLYDPETNRWAVRAPMPLPRCGQESVLLPEGKVLSIGGQPSLTSAPDMAVLTYDPRTDTWE